MCDNLGISDTKVRVYNLFTDDTTPCYVVFTDLKACFEWMKADIEEANGEQYKIKVGYMTESELENLPEFDG